MRNAGFLKSLLDVLSPSYATSNSIIGALPLECTVFACLVLLQSVPQTHQTEPCLRAFVLT